MSNGFLKSEGICVIPEGRTNKSCKEVGYPYEVTDIKLLPEILEYSRRNRLNVFYLSTKEGISYADDIISKPSYSVSKLSDTDWKKWSSIIAEEIARKCIQCQTYKVYIMCRAKYNNLDLVLKLLSSRGVEVVMPILGCTLESAKLRLML